MHVPVTCIINITRYIPFLVKRDGVSIGAMALPVFYPLLLLTVCLKLIFEIYVCVYICMCAVPSEARKGCPLPWSRGYQGLRVASWVQGIELVLCKSSQDLNHWAISGPWYYILKNAFLVRCCIDSFLSSCLSACASEKIFLKSISMEHKGIALFILLASLCRFTSFRSNSTEVTFL